MFHELHNGTTNKFSNVTIDPGFLLTFPSNPRFPQNTHSPRSSARYGRMFQSSDFTPKYGSPEVRTAEAYEDLRRSWRCPPKISRYHPTPPLLSHLWSLSTLSITYHPPQSAQQRYRHRSVCYFTVSAINVHNCRISSYAWLRTHIDERKRTGYHAHLPTKFKLQILLILLSY